MLKFLKSFAITALLASIFLSSSIVKAADSKKPIVIPLHNWSSQVVMSYVLGGIFESTGNNVEYVSADSQAVYESIRQGDVTISHEVWQSAFGASFDAARDAGATLFGMATSLIMDPYCIPKINYNLSKGY